MAKFIKVQNNYYNVDHIVKVWDYTDKDGERFTVIDHTVTPDKEDNGRDIYINVTIDEVMKLIEEAQ